MKAMKYVLLTKVRERRGDEDTIPRRWFYEVKDAQKNFLFKARLVAKEFAKNRTNNFTPVVNQASLKVLLSVTNHLSITNMTLDVQTDFLHDELEDQNNFKEIYFMRKKTNYVNLTTLFIVNVIFEEVKQTYRQLFSRN